MRKKHYLGTNVLISISSVELSYDSQYQYGKQP